MKTSARPTARFAALLQSASAERTLAWVLAVTLGIAHTIPFLFAMNPDGISYLRLADLYRNGDWLAAVNGYWSPIYPLLIAAASALADPLPYWEAPLAHVVNFVCYLIAFASFRFLLRSIGFIQSSRQTNTDYVVDYRSPAAWACAHGLFLMTMLVWIGLKNVTPDILVAAVVYGACGLALRLRQHRGYAGFILLGALAALGYMTKAVMFPLGIVFLLAAAWVSREYALGAKRAFAGLLGFFIVAAPQIVGVSRLVGHVSYAETGSLAYAKEVNHYPLFWTGNPVESGTPEHPIRILHESPAAYEFSATDIKSSYPFWDTPAYWTAGIRPSVDLAKQTAVTVPILEMYLESLAVLMFAAMVLFLCRTGTASSTYIPLVLPALGAFALYALVFAELRYLGAWTVVAFLGIVSTMRFPENLRRAVSAILVVIALSQGVGVVTETWKTWSGQSDLPVGHPSAHPDLDVASRLHSSGLRAGSRVAWIGYAFNEYWARLAGVQIAMQVPYDEEYWAASDSVRLAIHEQFRRSGATAIVTNHVPRTGPGKGWISAGRANYYLFPLEPSPGMRVVSYPR